MAESTPLLHEERAELEAQPSVPAEKPFKFLTITTLVLSVVTSALLIADNIIIKHAPFNGYTWAAREATKALGIWVFVSGIFAFINVLAPLPLLINVVIDTVFSVGIITWVFHLIDGFPNKWCGNPHPWPGQPDIEPHPKCEDWKFIAKILTGLAAALGGILGLVYITLLVLRSVRLFKSKFWKQPIALNFPAGKISLEISLKLLRQEPEPSGEPSSSSAHGPVYL